MEKAKVSYTENQSWQEIARWDLAWKYKFIYWEGNYEKIKAPIPPCTFPQLILGMICEIRVTTTILELEEL